MVNLWLNLKDPNRWKKGLERFFMAGTVFLLYVPLVVFILLSFNRPSAKGNISSVISPENWVGLDNYVEFFNKPIPGNFWNSLMNSLIIALFSIPLSIFLGVLTAVNVWKNFGKGKTMVYACSRLSIASPDIVQAISFLSLFTVLLVPLGFNFGFVTIVISHIAISIPYVVMFVYPRLEKLEKSLLYVANDLNFGFWGGLIHVIIPMIFPSLLGAAILVFGISFDDFIITNLIRGNITTITSELYTMKTGIKTWSSVFGSLMILIYFQAILLFNAYKFLRERND